MTSTPNQDPTESSLWGRATDWSLVERAAGRDGEGSRNEAWWELVQRYRHPIEVCLRARLPAHLVTDGVPGFFGYLFEHRLLAKADRERGRFRCYVQGVMRRWTYHFLRRERAPAQVDFDQGDEGRLADDPALDAEEDRAWASRVLARALAKLRDTRPHDTELLADAYGLAERPTVGRVQLAEQLDVRVGTLNVRLHEARRRLRACIEDELRDLCRERSSWDAEKKWMIGCLLRSHPTLTEDDVGTTDA